ILDIRFWIFDRARTFHAECLAEQAFRTQAARGVAGHVGPAGWASVRGVHSGRWIEQSGTGRAAPGRSMRVRASAFPKTGCMASFTPKNEGNEQNCRAPFPGPWLLPMHLHELEISD